LKEREEELKKALESAREANQAKTQFLSNMSHDIRTPMNAVVGFTSLAKLNIDNKEKMFEYLGKIENASDLLLRILNDILDITKIESGEITLTEDEIDIQKEVEAIDEIFSKLAEEHGVELTHDVSKVQDFRIYGDRLRLNQILMNIISNAIKYTEKGGYVRYSIAQSDSDREGCNRYTITVRDNGIGMSKEFLAHAFEIFTREKNSTMSKVMGTGLGMAIIKRLVDVMDGKIKIESEQGVGTTVVVDLDLKRRDTLDDTTSGDALEKEADDTILEGKKILVVDDQAVNRVIVKEMLSRYGVIVDEAEDGNDAIRKIESADDRYDIILMDVQMPVMNGYEATKRIREMEDLSKASSPIFAMTADAFADDKVKAQESGMNEHIAKPIDIRNTVKLIKKYLS
jgi:CheY-like chemotaxis protein